jgi:hypothetical protein
MDQSDRTLWEAYCDAHRGMVTARVALVSHAESLGAIIGDALADPRGRACALQLLLALPSDVSRPHIATLVELATFSQPSIAASRQIIHRLRDAAARAMIDEAVEIQLAAGSEWEFRRIAELYAGFDTERLEAHLRRCALHTCDAIRAIAEEYGVGTNAGEPQA